MRKHLLALSMAAVIATMALAGCLSDDEAPVQEVEPEPINTVELTPEIEELLGNIEGSISGNTTFALDATPVYNNRGLFGLPLPNPRSTDAVTFEVELRESGLLTNMTWAQIDDTFVDMPFVKVFEGHVVGDESKLVRITVADSWARGSVRVDDMGYLFRLGLNGNLPPLSSGDDGDEDGNLTLNGAYDWQKPPTTFDAQNWAEHDCLYLASDTARPVAEVGRSAESTLASQLILDADAQFIEALGDDAFPMMVAMTAETDSIYDYEVGIKFEIVGIHANTDAEYFPSPGDEAPLSALASYWNARNVTRDVVHLFTGQESGYAMANCIGGAGMPELAYTFTPLNWAQDYEVFHTTAYAHELGHIFSAHHHYGNHAEAGGELATVMIQGYTPGVNPVFSTVSKSHIRGWAETHVA